MKKLLYFVAVLAAVSMGLSSCESEGGGGGRHALEGDYICKKVEVYYQDGSSSTFTNKKDWVSDKWDDDWWESSNFEWISKSDYILFDYEYIFDGKGTYSFRVAYNEDMVNGGKYSVKGSTLSMSLTSLSSTEWSVYKIVSQTDDTLVLELGKEAMELNNELYEMFGGKRIRKSTATYQKQ